MAGENIISPNRNDAVQRNRPMTCNDLKMMYEQAKQLRSPYEQDWRTNAAFCLPRHYSGWLSPGQQNNPNMQAVKRLAYDATAARALPKFAAIMRRLATPDGHKWQRLQASVPELNKSYRVRAYFDQLTDIIFKLRYAPRAMFSQAVDETYLGLGCYGTAPVRMKWRQTTVTDRRGGFGYKAMPLRNCYPMQNGDGLIDTMFVRQDITARQFSSLYPNWTPSRSIAMELSKAVPSETRTFEVVHAVLPRDHKTYEPDALNARRHPYQSHYFVVEDSEYVGPEGGFRSFPYLIPRTATEPGELFGFSPAQQCSPAMGTVNAMKKTLLRQAQKAADPPLLAGDDGVISGRVGQTPGYVTFGAVNSQGKPLVHAIQAGDFQPAKEMLQDERSDIDDAFLVILFQILMETPEMTATEVIERTAEKAALAAPTMGRLQSGLLGPEVERAIDLMAEYAPQMLPPMPGELVEAQGEYEVIYTSPLAKMLHAEEDAGFIRILGTAIEVVGATQDPEPLDHFDFDTALPEIMEHQSVPTRWTTPPEKVAEKRAMRARQMEEQKAIQAAPAAAQLMSAQQQQGA